MWGTSCFGIARLKIQLEQSRWFLKHTFVKRTHEKYYGKHFTLEEEGENEEYNLALATRGFMNYDVTSSLSWSS